MAALANVTVDETTLLRSICLDSFYAFTQEFWHVVVPEEPVWNWHIEYLCDTFQKDAERVFEGLPKLHDTIVNISPGSTKSTILSVMAPAWVHARRPDMRILAASHTQALTFELGRKCRMVEESELYQRLFPHVVPSKDQWTKSLFINTKGGGRMAATVGGMSPTGFHAHFILVDDPLDPQQAKKATEAELNAANNFMSEVLPTRKVNKAVTVTWLIMQRLHQNDPTGYLLSKGKTNIRHICLPATKSPKVKPINLRRKYVDGLMDPVRLNRDILDEAEKDLGTYGYAGQFDQNPVPRGGGMFKVALIEIATPPRLTSPQWVGLVRFWDKAGTSGGGAYTAGVLMGRWRPAGAPRDGAEDVWWILNVVRGQWDSAEREATIKQTAIIDTKRVRIGIEQEPGSGGLESAQLTIKRLVGFKARAIPAVGDKIDRADAWSTLVNARAFKMAPGPWNEDFIDELRYFPYSTYKDQADAGSGAHAMLAEPVPTIGARK